MAKYVPVPNGTDLKRLNTQEIQAWLSGLQYSEVIRSILLAEIEAIRAGQPREQRTLRGLWYEIVKPILSRLGILNNLTSGNKPIEWDQKVSEILKVLVTEGFTSYEELKIIDGSRQRFAAQAITTRLIDVSMIGGYFPWVILFTEKDTIWPVISNLANIYGVSAISGGGQPANSCSENITREIIRSEAFQAAQPGQLVILALTDYDPAGYSIFQAQVKQMLDAAANIPIMERGNLKTVGSKRLGLTPDQLTPEEIEASAYEPKDKGLEKWLQETGGINGQALGLELDSLPISRLRGMFAREIEQHIDKNKRNQDLKQSFLELMACYRLLPEFERQRAELVEIAKRSPVWREIENVPVHNDLFLDAAIAGQAWISPDETLNLFSEYQEPIKELWEI